MSVACSRTEDVSELVGQPVTVSLCCLHARRAQFRPAFIGLIERLTEAQACASPDTICKAGQTAAFVPVRALDACISLLQKMKKRMKIFYKKINVKAMSYCVEGEECEEVKEALEKLSKEVTCLCRSKKLKILLKT